MPCVEISNTWAPKVIGLPSLVILEQIIIVLTCKPFFRGEQATERAGSSVEERLEGAQRHELCDIIVVQVRAGHSLFESFQNRWDEHVAPGFSRFLDAFRARALVTLQRVVHLATAM